MPENNFNKVPTLWTCQTYMENMSRVLKPEEILFGVLFFFGKYCVSYRGFWNNCPIIIAIWWWDEQTCLQRRTRFVWTSVASFSKVAFFCVKMGFLGVFIYRHIPSDLPFRCLDYYISWNLFVLRALGGVNVWTLSQLNILQMHPVRMFWWIWKAEEEKALTTWRTLIQETSFWAFVKKIGLALGQCFFILSLAMLITQLMRRGVGGWVAINAIIW